MKKRQFILIITDTQRKDMIGCYRNDNHMKTPNLDHLADKGVKFDNCYCAQPVCGPARSAIFTGLYPHSNTSWGNSMPLANDVKTVGQRLSENSINAAYIGKYHLDGGDYFGYGVCPDGWDANYWYDMRNYLEELTDDERRASRKFKTCLKPGFDESDTYANRCAKKAMDYIEKNKDNDYLLVLSFDEPHGPSLCPAPFNTMFQDYEFPKSENVLDTLSDKPEHQKVWAKSFARSGCVQPKIQAQDLFGCNSYVDYEIGRVIKQIEQYAPDAFVIYTSDHGDALHSHSIVGKGPAMYDEITNVPLIINWNQSKLSNMCDHLVSHIDITPTILDWFDIAIPKMLQGKSLLPLLKNDQQINEEVFMEFGRYEIDHDGFGGFMPVRCVFDGRYKLCINLLSEDELYDLQNDAQEINNLIEDPMHAEHRDRLHKRIVDWMNDTRDPFRGYVWSNRSWNKGFEPTWHHTGYTRQKECEEYPRQLDYDTGLEMITAVRKKF